MTHHDLTQHFIPVDAEDRRRVEGLLAGEKHILEMVAKGDALCDILDSLCRLLEQLARGALASILLRDGDRLWHGGAPSLPKVYTEAIDGGVIGPRAGSCGTAAYRREPVIVEDIAVDPLWVEYREAALPHGLRACWSNPVFSSSGDVIATFAMYYREPRSPSRRDQEIIEQMSHLAGVAIDHKLTQDKLRRSEAYLAEGQRLTHTGSWAWTPATGEFTYLSEECFRVLGFDPAGRPPRFEEVLRRIHPDERAAFKERLEGTGRERMDLETDLRIVDANGAVRTVLALGHPVLGSAGDVVELIGTVIDLTERNRADETVRQAHADLAYVSRVTTMGELAASLAHELNQPIAAAVTNARTCLRWLSRAEPDLAEARAAASRIVDDGTRAADIISRIRLQFLKDAPQRERVDVNEVIREMTVLLHNEASRYSISVRTDLAADLPYALADRVQLQQVLMNLMLNAIQAMQDVRPGELTIRSQVEGGQILVSVTDTGVGLQAETEKIFRAFYTTKPGGIGMGLKISRSIIESHGGRLWAIGNAGPGATFYLTLPS